MDLHEALRRNEGKTLEFKRDLSSPDGVLRTVVAFANTAGGTLLIGIEDRTRRVRGISNPLEMEERLANIVSDSVSPHLLPEVAILPFRRTHVVAVQIFPSGSRPHFLKRMGLQNGTYVRVGSINRRADSELIAEMQRFARGESFDERPMPDLDSEVIDFRVASESFAQVRRLTRRDLRTLGLVSAYQGRIVPTVGGVVLFGNERLSHFPDAWIQAGRFDGRDKSTILDQASLRLPPIQAIKAAVEFVEKHSARGVSIGAVRRMERWSLPPVAIREAVVNSVAHADYSQRSGPIRLAIFDDRLEIESPGLLPFGLTVADLEHGVSKLRNRVIGRVFHEVGLVEQWGSGIQRMNAACRDAGLAQPILEEIGNRFRVTLRIGTARDPNVDSIDGKILELVNVPEGRATREIADHIGLTPRATRTRLSALVELGLVKEIGSGPQDPRRRYFRTEGG